ncbi:cytochrome P450 [Fusarium albosuccineum]|uniref:Cytochrome P450 n=1 Tax=Fusarium albosuccineum TaxID=1237068 RepID=A0A8H4LB16_9HYPO|nr:cytochrome P450 [Fusarium albosuccineum]
MTQVPFSLAWISGAGHKKIYDLHQKYGDIVRVAPNQLSFGYPEAWNDIMGHRKRGQAENGKDPDFWRGDDPYTLVGSNRERHSRLRKILSHGFSAQAMMEQQPVFQRYVNLMIDRLKSASSGDQAVEMTKWLNWATFDMAGDLIFGESFGCLEKSEYHPWVKLLFRHIQGIAVSTALIRYPFADALIKLMTPKSIVRDIQAHNDFTEAQVGKRMAYKNPRPDFMESMIRAHEKDQVSHREILANAHNLIVGSSETTATTLAGTIYLLAVNKPVLTKLYKEIKDSFQTEHEIDLLSVQKLEYMFAVLHEGLRIYPAVPAAIPRKTSEGAMIGAHYVPADTILGVWQWPIFHNPKFFRDAESFVPERWLGDPAYQNDQRAAVQPFSVGPRNCIGKNLAYAEMRLILAKLIWHFDVDLDPRSEGWLERNTAFLLWEKPELWVRLTPRRDSQSEA